jgi:hypothetical protein
MTAKKYSARDCEFQIEDPGAPGTWVAIAPGAGGTGGGINTFTKSHSSSTSDLTTFGSEGNDESQVMGRGKTLGLQGFRLKDPDTGALDAGQALVEALADQVSDASVGTIRFAAPGDTTWEVWSATAELGDEGGGNNDKTSWAVTFTRTGPATTAAKP